MDRVLEYEIPSEYDGANITTVLKQHFKISTNLIKDLKKYKEGIQVNTNVLWIWRQRAIF